jgi:hypothetical protein
MEILSVAAELFHADVQTDMMKLTVALRTKYIDCPKFLEQMEVIKSYLFENTNGFSPPSG